jgi:hypothetical protein
MSDSERRVRCLLSEVKRSTLESWTRYSNGGTQSGQARFARDAEAAENCTHTVGAVASRRTVKEGDDLGTHWLAQGRPHFQKASALPASRAAVFCVF